MAITPKEAMNQFKQNIPEKVFTCWNELIVANLRVSNGNSQSQFTLKELSSKIQYAMNTPFKVAKKNGWFDLEDHYNNNGWDVTFDSPGYNESYEATYFFKTKK